VRHAALDEFDRILSDAADKSMTPNTGNAYRSHGLWHARDLLKQFKAKQDAPSAVSAIESPDAKDAARYRYLRSQAYAELVELGSWYLSFDMQHKLPGTGGMVSSEMCDAAVDAEAATDDGDKRA
jgi:hypothetical protein